MLTNVPSAVNRMARNVVINHPNTWECQVFRKRVTRTDGAPVGGLPTMGGLGVLEFLFITGLPNLNPADVLAALIVFRLLYLLIPFGISLIVVLIFEKSEFSKKRKTQI